MVHIKLWAIMIFAATYSQLIMADGFSASGYVIYSKPTKDEVDSSTYLNISPAYNFSQSDSLQTNLSASFDYTHFWAKYQDEDNSYVEAITFSASQTHRIKGESTKSYGPTLNSLSYAINFALPANESDQDAGFNGSLGFNGSISGNILANNRWALSSEVIFYSFTYDTANEAGTIYNRKWSGDLSARLATPILRKLTWKNSARILTYTNTIDNSYQVYSASTGIGYQWNENLGTSASFSASDRVETTRRFLDDDTTAFRIGLEWQI